MYRMLPVDPTPVLESCLESILHWCWFSQKMQQLIYKVKSIPYFLSPILYSLLEMFNEQICRVETELDDNF